MNMINIISNHNSVVRTVMYVHDREVRKSKFIFKFIQEIILEIILIFMLNFNFNY